MNQKLMFVPIPLATGDTLPHPESGRDAQVAGISVTLTLTDGTTVTRPLEHRDSAWWGPQDYTG